MFVKVVCLGSTRGLRPYFKIATTTAQIATIIEIAVKITWRVSARPSNFPLTHEMSDLILEMSARTLSNVDTTISSNVS